MASSFSARESRPLASTLQPKPQLDSLFLTKLVPEIRHMIYKYAFGGYKNLHIFIYEQSLVSLRCQNPTAVRLGGHDKCTGMSMYRSLGFDWNHGALKERPDPDSNHHISDILTACRTIYLESIDVLYKTRILYFSNLISVIVFPRAILSRHLEVLQHVRLSLALTFDCDNGFSAYFHNSFSRDWPGWDETSAPGDTPWECTWNTIAEMKTLHTLHVTLEVEPWFRRGRAPADFEASLFQPLERLTCNDFLIRVNWPPGEDQSHAYPFRLERIEMETEIDQT